MAERAFKRKKTGEGRRFRLQRHFIFLTAFLLCLTACIPEGFGGPDPCDEGGVLLRDEFEGNLDCGWTLYNQGGALVEVADGEMHISSSQTGQIWWTNPNRQFEDVVITVDARQVGGPDDNAYGVICRYQNESNFYLFLISGDGFYAIAKYQSGSRVEYLSGEGQFQPSDAINQGVATNQIQVTCDADELALAVNGIPLATVNDPTFVVGDVGVGTSTFQPGTAAVAFDNFQVIAP